MHRKISGLKYFVSKKCRKTLLITFCSILFIVGCSSGGGEDVPTAEISVPVIMKLCHDTSLVIPKEQIIYTGGCNSCTVVPVEIAYQEVLSKLQESGYNVPIQNLKVVGAYLTELYLIVPETVLTQLTNIEITLNIDSFSTGLTNPSYGYYSMIENTAFRFQPSPIDIITTLKNSNQLCYNVNLNLRKGALQNDIPIELRVVSKLVISAKLPGKAYSISEYHEYPLLEQ